MNVSKELLDHIMKKAKGQKDEAAFIADQLNNYRKFEEERLRFDRERQNARDICKKNIALIDQKEKKNQGLCDHPVRTFHADSSGNNDSWSECNYCGADVQRSSGQAPAYDG